MSTVVETNRTYSVDEFLALPNAQDFELVRGRLVEPSVSVLSSLVEGTILRILSTFTDSKILGIALTSSV
jgi:hypothetical protein